MVEVLNDEDDLMTDVEVATQAGVTVGVPIAEEDLKLLLDATTTANVEVVNVEDNVELLLAIMAAALEGITTTGAVDDGKNAAIEDAAETGRS